MTNGYNVSTTALLKRIGLSPGKKALVFFITLIIVTLPMEHIYNSIAVICFALYAILSCRRHNILYPPVLLLPMALFVLMAASVLWSIDVPLSLKALGKEAPLFFIPLAFGLSRPLRFKSLDNVLRYFSSAMCLTGIYLILRAIIRYIAGGDTSVFFFDEFASQNVSLYLATFFSLAMFVFLCKQRKTFWGYAAMVFLFLLVMLLSKKIIIITDTVIVAGYYLFFSTLSKKIRIYAIILFAVLAGGLCYYGNIAEIIGNEMDKPSPEAIAALQHNVTMAEALQKQTFTPNDYLNGYAFRLYQARTAKELITADHVVLTGYGINTSSKKLEQKGVERNLVHSGWQKEPYNKLNFHDQYIEAFADLGLAGFLLVVAMVVYNLICGLKSGYFIHIAFAILMIALFLTESFLWRQKGVVFFSLFYCLFNDLLPSGKTQTSV